MANRLAHETSPYLRQHADNPVDWYPWGEEALGRARAEDKPILLSVGYSACHWCHVMAHECFENPQIAAVMNAHFINIKVDREERPDLDQIYQNVSQLMTRSGGWPLTVFLTPDLEPYFGGTYFPPEDRYGRPGFPRVLTALAEAYKSDRANVAENAKRLTHAIGQLERNQVAENKRPTAAALRQVCDTMLGGIDWHNGGFGGAPKFPNTVNLSYLWRFGQATGFGMAQEAALNALTKMAKGGIYDQLGGGFHRYTVDGAWVVPHFEKMLYDNALLVRLYAEALLAGTSDVSAEDRELYGRVLSETVAYLLREMRSPEGGFYSAQDADSEGVEGKYFVWNPRSLREALSEQEARAIELRLGVTPQGNFEGHGETVLTIARPLHDVARELGESPHDALERLEAARAKLFAARGRRVAPGRDDKIIASWNGLTISALAWAGRALRAIGNTALAEEAAASAAAAFELVRARFSYGDGRLHSVFKDGQARFNGYLDDYAFCAMAALDLARQADSPAEAGRLAAQARAWIDVVRAHFTDRDGGFFFTADDHEKLIHRPKTIFDQAIPSGNAVAIQCLVALGELYPESSYATEADEHLYKFFPTLEKASLGMGELACAALAALTSPVTVSGPRAFEACVHPNVYQKDAEPGARDLVICHRRTCEAPQSDPGAARAAALKKTHLAT